MNFSFMSPGAGQCTARLWASGRYGFSLPKKVEITTAAGATHVFLYFDKRVEIGADPGKRALVCIAIAQFLRGDDGRAEPVEIDPDLAPYAGVLTPVRTPTPRAPLRVRPGKTHARPASTS